MSAALKTAPEYGDGDGSGPFDPRDVAIYILETTLAEFRDVMRRLLDSEGEEATRCMAEAEKLLDAYDTVDREVEDEEARDAFHASPVCDCGTWKGVGTSYCPECDADALARLKAMPATRDNVTPIGRCPF